MQSLVCVAGAEIGAVRLLPEKEFNDFWRMIPKEDSMLLHLLSHHRMRRRVRQACLRLAQDRGLRNLQIAHSIVDLLMFQPKLQRQDPLAHPLADKRYTK
jgi:hypothetical protein